MAALTLRLTLTVEYDTYGVPTDILIDALKRVALRAADEGFLIGDTEAVVEGWRHKVEKVQ